MLVNVFLIIGIGNEEKRKERSQVAYERKKLVNKLKAKVEKIVDKKLGSQFEVGVCMAFDLCGIFVILLSGCFVLHCLSWGRFNEDRVHNFYQSVYSQFQAKRLLGEAIVLEYSLYGCLNISRCTALASTVWQYCEARRLNNNKLTGRIPRELTKLRNLKIIDLSNNDLSLWYLPHIRHLLQLLSTKFQEQPKTYREMAEK
ncbi:hypothetical protein P8452_63494 [Trifolium repens]|nr:hypothetical protein P8452_63494 [Trifolium repens]